MPVESVEIADNSLSGVNVAANLLTEGYTQLFQLATDADSGAATLVPATAQGLGVHAYRATAVAHTKLDSTDNAAGEFANATPAGQVIVADTNAATRTGFQLQNTGDVDLWVGFGANDTAAETAADGADAMLLRVGQDYGNSDFAGAVAARPVASTTSPEIRATEFY